MKASERALMRVIGKLEKRKQKKKFVCLHPGCNRLSINSHSQQKEGQLRAISRRGEVYAQDRNFYRAKKRSSKGDEELHYSLQGIKETSIFPGFCQQHDSENFAPIENYSLIPNTQEQSFCLFLRAFAYEYCQKRSMLWWQQRKSRMGRKLLDQNRKKFDGVIRNYVAVAQS